MSVTHLTALRTILADTVDDHVNTGAGTAKLRLRASSTTIVDINLSNPAFGAAASGVITLSGVPLSGVAGASGNVDNGQIINRNGDISLSFSVTATGGGGDATMDNVNVASGQTVQLTALTYTAPA